MTSVCLYIDPWDHEGTVLREGWRGTRRSWHCSECGRDTEPGERMWVQTTADNGTVSEARMCEHCRAAVTVGASLAGCPEQWYWGFVWDRYEDGASFALDIASHSHLTRAQIIGWLRLWVGARRKWRNADGGLLPVPS